MKGSLMIISFFLMGCLVGWSDMIPSWLNTQILSKYVLFILMFQVGIGVGSDQQLESVCCNLRPRLLLIPLATMIGTLLFSFLASLVIIRWGWKDCLAVGSGFGYYSLSSILIMQLKEPFIGQQAATELGTLALMTNVIRELIVLFASPLLVRLFGRLAPICSGGATTMDTTMPVILKYAGKEYAFAALLHGFIVDFSVPFYVSFFCL